MITYMLKPKLTLKYSGKSFTVSTVNIQEFFIADLGCLQCSDGVLSGFVMG